MKALVSGGCGFIGSYLTDDLMAQGYEVLVFDNLSRGRYIWNKSGPRLVEETILDQSAVRRAMREFQPDLVFHMAAHHYIPYCEKNPHDAFTTNVCGTLNLVEAAREAKSVKKFFLASTGDVYAPSSYPHSETDQPSPVYVYGETKLMAEMLVKRYHNSVQAPFDITIGRLFNAAGPRETNPHLLPEIVRQISTGTTTIEVGNTWPMRDFVDVRSMATTIREITEKTIGVDVFNIGSGKVQPVQNALDLLIKAHGRDVTVVSVEARKRANDRPYLCPAVNKLQNAIGHAAVSFGDSTAKAIWDEPPETRILYR